MRTRELRGSGSRHRRRRDELERGKEACRRGSRLLGRGGGGGGGRGVPRVWCELCKSVGEIKI